MSKIDVYCNDGSPLGVTMKTVYGDGQQIGVGGAELALLTMCQAWKEAGHDVTLYNSPREYNASSFDQRLNTDFNPNDDRDFFISFRSPNRYAMHRRSLKGQTIWWSCDQMSVGNYRDFAIFQDKIVTISPRHAEYFSSVYGIDHSITIDLPVRGWDYMDVVERNMKQVIFCSVPDRGAEQLAQAWEIVVKAVPDAKLVITSDWRLWDKNCSPRLTDRYRLQFAQFDNVEYHGALGRAEMCRLQQQSAIHLYPCTYDELFCIAVAETQYAGAYPITTRTGALNTTNMGYQGDSVKDLAQATIEMLTHPEDLKYFGQAVQKKAVERFSIERIVKQWNENIFCS